MCERSQSPENINEHVKATKNLWMRVLGQTNSPVNSLSFVKSVTDWCLGRGLRTMKLHFWQVTPFRLYHTRLELEIKDPLELKPRRYRPLNYTKHCQYPGQVVLKDFLLSLSFASSLKWPLIRSITSSSLMFCIRERLGVITLPTRCI